VFFGSPRSPFINMSSSHESSLLSTSVSILDGLNYLVWKNQMKAWLQSKGLWQIMSGNKRKFPEAAENMPSTMHETNYKACMDWDNKDDQAYGMILLKVNPSVAIVTTSITTARDVWQAFHTAFGQTGPLAIFTEFKSVISQKISMAMPTLNIMAMNENFQCLTAATIIIPEIMQAMILLNAMPKEYDRVMQTTLQTMEQSKLTLNYV